MNQTLRIVTIDSVMHGIQGVTAVYYLPGPRPAIIEAAPATSVGHVLAGLSAAGVCELDWIVLTHIHLDHAGAAGHLAQRLPRARVVVREEGARHLVDPSRLWASAARLYPDMEGLWGTMLPVPAERMEETASMRSAGTGSIVPHSPSMSGYSRAADAHSREGSTRSERCTPRPRPRSSTSRRAWSPCGA